MSELYFYEKTACINNTKQKELLNLAKYDYEAVDIIKHNWTKEELLKFFDGMETKDYFNRKSPRVKSGEIIPENYTKEETIKLLLEDHLLIKRPLLKIKEKYLVGFDMERIESILGKSKTEDEEEYEKLLKEDLTTCPQERLNTNCDEK